MSATADETPRWERILLRALEIPVGIVVLGMMFLVTANAISRRVFGTQISGTLELTEAWFMPFIAAIGIFIAHIRRDHVAADLFFSTFTNVQKKWLTVVTEAATGLLFIAFTYFTMLNAVDALSVGQVAGGSRIPSWPAYFIVPIAFIGFAAMAFVHAFRTSRAPASAFETDHEGEALEEIAELAEQDVTGSIRVPSRKDVRGAAE